MKVLLFHLDGSLPNLALMRIADHHRRLRDEVRLQVVGNPRALERTFWDQPDKVYGSAIFTKTMPMVHRLLNIWPEAVVGGTGWNLTTLEDHGIQTHGCDYGIYPNFRQSIGFTQRGCRLSCEFCVVPKKEGKVRPESTIAEIWRGGTHPKELILLDNDFFGQPGWRDRIAEIRDGGFKVSFSQGINARCLTEEAAEAIGSILYYNNRMTARRIYTAWDNREDEERLVRYGVKPDEIMVYMLCGYWPGETQIDREYRRYKLRLFGCRPYPMPYIRTKELVGFQRWVVGAYDKRIAWASWERAGYRPENL